MSSPHQLRLPSRDAAIDLLAQLVSIDSVNPSLVPGAAGEGQIARFVARWLQTRGFDVEMPEVAAGRPNVVGRLRRSGGRSLILNAHTDTVGVAGMDRPFEARVEGDRLFGRGAYDMKGGLAAILLAAEMAADAGMGGGEVIVAAVADEEYASLGTEALVGAVHGDAAIVTEPTGLRICTAHKGFAWIRIETVGRAAHGSRPDLGVDAIAHMGRVLGALEARGARLAAGDFHPLLWTGSVHASLIAGGQELSSYPERCRLEIERRTIPGETAASVGAEVEEMLDDLRRADPAFAGTAELYFWRDPFEVDRHAPIVAAVTEAATGVLGSAPEVYGDTPWMDAAILSAHGIPTVVFGPGGAGAHAMEEYVSIEQVIRCAEILARTVTNFCSFPDIDK